MKRKDRKPILEEVKKRLEERDKDATLEDDTEHKADKTRPEIKTGNPTFTRK